MSKKGKMMPVENVQAAQTAQDANWWLEERKRVDEGRRKAMAEKGLYPYLKLQEGITTVEFVPEIPRKRTNNFGKDVADFHVRVDGQDFLWSVNVNTTLYRQIIDLIANGTKVVKVIRAGQGKMPRYSLQSRDWGV